jgi:hypothetical protein
LKQGETSNSTGDVWALGLLSFFGPEFTWVSLDDLLAKPHQLRKVKRSQERDRVFFYLDLTHEKGRLELWFDPQVNFLVRRLVLTSNFPGAGEKRAENEVVRFKEVAPAIYFPEQVELQVYKDAKVESKRSVTFSNIRVNQPLPAEVFRLRFPDGVNLVDSIQGRMYKVDAEGREIGPARDEKGAELHLAKSPPFPADTSQQANLTQTQEEPQPAAERLAHWVVLLSLVILASAGGLWLRWRKRPMPA